MAALVVVLLAGFTLRAICLDNRPLWWDGGNNVYFAHQGLLGVLQESRATLDTDPPMHRLALGVWKELVGSSPFSMRFFAALAGVLSIALSWALGSWLGGRRVALLGALFVTLAPMQVHYGREAKGYTFATALALLSTYAWGCRLGYVDAKTKPVRNSKRWWVVYVLSTASALATRYCLAPLVLWQGLWTVVSPGIAITRARSNRSRNLAQLSRRLLAAGGILSLLLPWAVPLFGSTVRGAEGVSNASPLSLPIYLGKVGQAIGAGLAQAGLHASLVSFGLLILASAGLLALNRGLFWATSLAVPLVGAYLIQSAFSFFFPRFLLYLGPICYLIAAHGMVTVTRSFPSITLLVLTVVVIGLWMPGLWHVYARPTDQAENPRPVVARLRAVSRLDDALVYVYIWQVGYVLGHYPQNELSFYRAYWPPQTVGEELTSILDSHPRLWRMSYDVEARDPHNLPNAWLEDNAYRVESTWYGRHNLALYVAPDFRTPGAGPVTKTASFDGKIELSYLQVDAKLRPGDVLALPLRWRALAEPGADCVVFVHVGLPDTPPLAQNDEQPHNGLELTGTWNVGQAVLARHALLLPQDMASGRYLVQVGLYRASDGIRLPPNGANWADALTLGYVEVGR
jgi:hypothetical protein